MAVSVAQLTQPLVKSTVLADVYTLLGRAFGSPLELDPGSPVAGILDAVVGWAVDDIWNPLVVPALQAPFLDFATGDWLSLIAALVYNRPRILAQSGTQLVTFENRSTGGSVSQAAGTVRIKAVTGNAVGKTFTTTTALAIAAWTGSGAYPTGTATVSADIAGTASNALAADIGTFATGTPLVAGPVGCYVQSVAGSILGTDQETDPDLVVRCRLAVSEASDMGPRAEYQSIALDPVGAFTRRNLIPPTTWGVAQPSISRVTVIEAGSGIVNVYLASPSGGAAGSMSDVNSDVGKAYVAILMFVVPPGITCNVFAAVGHTVNPGSIVITLNAASNITSVSAVATATAGLIAFFENLQIGGSRLTTGGTGYVFEAAVSQACWGPGVVDVSVAGLNDDSPFALAANEVATLGAYTITANVVSQGS